MDQCTFSRPATRREFLKTSGKGIGLLAFSNVAPAFVTQSLRAGTPRPEKDRSILVLVQLAGGNDGLNTVIPWSDDRYYKLRPKISLREKDLLKISTDAAFHSACKGMHRLFEEGKLGIIQGVGYPNPNRSHFRSMEIWETASNSDEYLTEGWLGRYLDNACEGSPENHPCGLSIGNSLPDAFLSTEATNAFSLRPNSNRSGPMDPARVDGLTALEYPEHSNGHYLQHTLMNTLVTERKILEALERQKSLTEYPSNALGNALSKVARLIAAGTETRVYFVSHTGFDTHANQSIRHRRLLDQLSQGLLAFQTDLEAHGLAQQVLTMTFSEFGRRPTENASGGTDHGTAAPLFVMGSQVQGGLHGIAPGLDIAENTDLEHTTDFRAVYSTVLETWLSSDPTPVLGKSFAPMNFIQS